MMGVTDRFAANDDRIAVDEVGIAIGLIAEFKLKTAFQPVFRRDGDSLVLVAMSSSSVLQRGGKPAPSDVLEKLTLKEGAWVARLASRLAVKNFPNIGCDFDELDLLSELPGVDGPGQVNALLGEAESLGLSSRQIIFDVTEPAQAADLERVQRALASRCASISTDLAAAPAVMDATGLEGLRVLVRLRAPVFRRIMRESVLQGLLRPLVATIQRRGLKVQIEGIATADELRVAIAVGADRFQGDFLARPALAGTDVDDRPRMVRDIVGSRGNVVSFSA